jgi:hypothetical protein
MMAHLEDELDTIDHDWRASECRVRYVQSRVFGITTDSDARCLTHIIHLAAKHIIQAFSQDGPTMESDFPMDALPANIDDGDLETSYTSGDTLGKLWAFINQVRLSPQASTFFFKGCAEEGP